FGEGFDVIGVVTQPDKPQGRSRTPVAPPVKQVALDEGAPCFQPVTAKGEEFFDTIEAMQPDISVVVAYGHILPRRVIDMPRLGTINIHASLLPQLRGAAPIQASIRQGFRQTGITIMRMEPALDAGPIILSATVPILEDETYGELQNRLSELGALTLLEALALISLGEAAEVAQDDRLATYAPKVTRDDARIDWSLSADEVGRTVRAYDPKPSAFTTLMGTDVKMFGARPVQDRAPESAADRSPGEVISIREGIVVACGNGLVCIRDVQPAGKTRMRAAEWARGRGVSIGDRFGG
ncbi:MAG: methionyl-tRNA formyltransferase, partial [Gemmatimonadaceae bacterium]